MTVEEYDEVTGTVFCTWFAKNERLADEFDPATLTRVDPDEPRRVRRC